MKCAIALNFSATLFIATLTGCCCCGIPSSTTPTTSTSKSTLMEQAYEAYDNDDNQKAIDLVEQELAANPENDEALYLHAEILEIEAQSLLFDDKNEESLALYKRATASVRKLKELGFEDDYTDFPACFYDQACAAARLGDTDLAISSLREAFDAGWDDLEHTESDSDLDPIRELDGYKTLIEELRASGKFEGGDSGT